MTQRISADGYDALREALATTTWFRGEFKRLVHTLLRDHPELVAPLNFDQTKRMVSDELVSLLMRHENRYHDFILSLMVELSAKSHEELSRPVDHDLAEVEARGITEGGQSRWGDLAGPRDEWQQGATASGPSCQVLFAGFKRSQDRRQ